MYLNRIRRDRQDGRFEERGEQIMRMEYVAERQKWDERMKRDADRLFAVDLDAVVDEEGDGLAFSADVDADADADADMRALDEYISAEQAVDSRVQDQHQSLDQGSGQSRYLDDGASYSDEEYEDIFMDLPDPVQRDPGPDLNMDVSS